MSILIEVQALWQIMEQLHNAREIQLNTIWSTWKGDEKLKTILNHLLPMPLFKSHIFRISLHNLPLTLHAQITHFLTLCVNV